MQAVRQRSPGDGAPQRWGWLRDGRCQVCLEEVPRGEKEAKVDLEQAATSAKIRGGKGVECASCGAFFHLWCVKEWGTGGAAFAGLQGDWTCESCRNGQPGCSLCPVPGGGSVRLKQKGGQKWAHYTCAIFAEEEEKGATSSHANQPCCVCASQEGKVHPCADGCGSSFHLGCLVTSHFIRREGGGASAPLHWVQLVGAAREGGSGDRPPVRRVIRCQHREDEDGSGSAKLQGACCCCLGRLDSPPPGSDGGAVDVEMCCNTVGGCTNRFHAECLMGQQFGLCPPCIGMSRRIPVQTLLQMGAPAAACPFCKGKVGSLHALDLHLTLSPSCRKALHTRGLVSQGVGEALLPIPDPPPARGGGGGRGTSRCATTRLPSRWQRFRAW